jgi:hypothetical protein
MVSEIVNKVSLECRNYSYDAEQQVRGPVVRVNMKQEIPIRPLVLQPWKAVKASLRRSYVMQSSSCPNISFRYELVQYWTASNRETVDMLVKRWTEQAGEKEAARFEPTYTFECEIEGPLADLSRGQQILVFCSLALKMKDLLDAFEVQQVQVRNLVDAKIEQRRFSVLPDMPFARPVAVKREAS